MRTSPPELCSTCTRDCWLDVSASAWRYPHAGGNGKQIFGDAWWLEPEEDARLAAELAGPYVQGMDKTSASHTAVKPSFGMQGAALLHAFR